MNQRNNKKSKKIKKKKKSNILFKFFVFICLILSIVSGIVFGICKTKYDGDLKKMAIEVSTIFLGEAKAINVLVVGISEDIDVELADTIMLCRYNPKNEEASIISIPRDTFVGKNKNNAKGSDKINSKYKKGIEAIETYVEELTNVEIDKYVVVKTSMLIDIVDTIGGVNFEVPIDMNYDDPTQNLHIHLNKGMQEINGEKAEQLLRFRHNNDGSTYPAEYGNNDFGRMRTQREFIKTVIKQTIDIKNIFKIKDLIDTVFDKLETNLNKNEIISYIPHVLNFSMENLKMEQLPGESKKCNGVWIYLHDEDKTEELIEELNIQ